MEYAGSHTHDLVTDRIDQHWPDMAREVWEFFLYSSLFLTAAATGMAYVSCLIQGFALSLPAAAILGMVVFSVYNLNRKTDEAEDALNHASRFRVTSAYSRQLFMLAIAAYAGALCIAASCGITAIAVAAVPLLSGILYSSPILPQSFGYRRLKEIPVVKNIVVSFAWGCSFSLLPVTVNGAAPGYPALIAFILIFCWTFIASTLPDIRDSRGDAETGICTIPVLLGIPRTRQILTVFNLVSGALLYYLAIRFLFPDAILVIVLSLFYSEGCILGIGRLGDDDLLCDVISDGQFLVIGAAALIICTGNAYHVAGLLPP